MCSWWTVLALLGCAKRHIASRSTVLLDALNRLLLCLLLLSLLPLLLNPLGSYLCSSMVGCLIRCVVSHQISWCIVSYLISCVVSCLTSCMASCLVSQRQVTFCSCAYSDIIQLLQQAAILLHHPQ